MGSSSSHSPTLPSPLIIQRAVGGMTNHVAIVCWRMGPAMMFFFAGLSHVGGLTASGGGGDGTGGSKELNNPRMRSASRALGFSVLDSYASQQKKGFGRLWRTT